jgi:hypothetical protein
MRIKPKFIASSLAAGAVAVAIAAAAAATAQTAPAQPTVGASTPAAQSEPAQPQQSCTNLRGSQTLCQSPGNAQLDDSPPQVNFFPLGDG